MLLIDAVNRVKNKTRRGNIAVTGDATTQQIIDAVNDARRDVIRLLPKQWLRASSTFNTTPLGTYGTSTSAASPSTSTVGTTGSLTLNINGDGVQSITLATNLMTGAGIALAIQNAVQGLTAATPYNARAYQLFTAVYSGGLYVLTSGLQGTGSSVVVTSTGNIGSTLGLGLANSGVEVAGSGATPQNPLALPLYDLPSDCQEPLLLRYAFNGADYFLSKVESEREFYLNVFGTTVAPNRPLFFFDAGVNQTTNNRQIYIWPIADITYEVILTYMVDPTLTDLTVANLNSRIPVFPSYVDDVLWKGARYYFLQTFDDASVAAAKEEYEEAKLAMEIADERDLDSDLQFRMDVGRRLTDFRSPGTGIRLR